MDAQTPIRPLRRARTVMVAYRQIILAKKRQWGTRPGHPSVKRAARSLIHYRAWLTAYLVAKQAIVRGREFVDV